MSGSASGGLSGEEISDATNSESTLTNDSITNVLVGDHNSNTLSKYTNPLTSEQSKALSDLEPKQENNQRQIYSDGERSKCIISFSAVCSAKFRHFREIFYLYDFMLKLCKFVNF